MKAIGASNLRLTIRLVAVAITLLITAHRLPAPILEEVPQATPTPKPKRETAPRPKPKPESSVKPLRSPALSFAGNWAGPVTAISSDGQRQNSNYILRISDDEKTVWINWNLAGQNISGAGYQVPCNRFGGALTWSIVFPEEVITDTLQLNANGTANFTAEGRWTVGDNAGLTFTHTGVFLRQGFSAPSVPQTAASPSPTTTTAALETTGIPTAKPVPNKPGFVYNPFDPHSRTLLDVRSKASGAKVKDPFSGKLFIVP